MSKITLLPEIFSALIVSIDIRDVSDDTILKLSGYESFKDQVLEEHLYATDVEEDIAEKEPLTGEAASDIAMIRKICHANDASYFRLVKP